VISYELIDKGLAMISFGGQDFVAILMRDPVIFPYVNFGACSNLPTTPFIEKP
jgi:hypothetical protein